jgi:2-dehydropantoate 2-reductase
VRILVVGAGAIGGYFGGRLLRAGIDVTFLVRTRRKQELESSGLIIKSPHGEVTVRDPPTLLANELRGPFDLVLLSCKAYDLEDAMASFAPAVGPATSILPLLNGMKHLDMLGKAFGDSRVLGGQCVISVRLDSEHAVVQLSEMQTLSFGERSGGLSGRVASIAETLSAAPIGASISENIVLEMWEKWVALATLAGMTCLMRASIGDILKSPDGAEIILSLLEECRRIAEAAGYKPRSSFMGKTAMMLTTKDSTLTASMFGDIENKAPVEADHILGDLLNRKLNPEASGDLPSLLRVAYAHVKAYEIRRARAVVGTPTP